MTLTYEVNWSERHEEWVAWCHQYGASEFRAPDPVSALKGLIELLDAIALEQ